MCCCDPCTTVCASRTTLSTFSFLPLDHWIQAYASPLAGQQAVQASTKPCILMPVILLFWVSTFWERSWNRWLPQFQIPQKRLVSWSFANVAFAFLAQLIALTFDCKLIKYTVLYWFLKYFWAFNTIVHKKCYSPELKIIRFPFFNVL